jgi:thiosulfate reductase/polysulfide reductase chain A
MDLSESRKSVSELMPRMSRRQFVKHTALAAAVGAVLASGVGFNDANLTTLKHVNAADVPEVKYVKTTHQHAGTEDGPITVKVVDGRAVSYELTKGIPYFPPVCSICGWTGLDYLYNPDKLKYPLKRVGERGKGEFKRITWDEALTEIANVFKKHLDDGHPEYVSWWSTHMPLQEYFHPTIFHHYPTPNDCHTSRTGCQIDAHVAKCLSLGCDPDNCATTQGSTGTDNITEAQYMLYHQTHTDTKNIRNIYLGVEYTKAVGNGAKVVFVDPRLSPAAYTYGAEWVPIKPSTDAAFNLGLINVIIREKLYDEDFLLKCTNAPILIKPDRYALKTEDGQYLVWDTATNNVKPLEEFKKTSGTTALLGTYSVNAYGFQGECKTAFQLLKERVETDYTLSKVEEITDVPAAKLEEISRDLSVNYRNVAAVESSTGALYHNSMQFYRSSVVLHSLIGQYDKPGRRYFGWSAGSGVSLNSKEDFRVPLPVPEVWPPQWKGPPRVDWDPSFHRRINSSESTHPNGFSQLVTNAILTGKPYPIKVAFIIASDCVASCSNPTMREAWKKCEFIVKSHWRPDSDTDWADIVLPEAAHLERDEGYVSMTGYDQEHPQVRFTFLTTAQAVVKPEQEQRPWWDYMWDLFEKINGKRPEYTVYDVMNWELSKLGIDLDYLREHGWYTPKTAVTRVPAYGKLKGWNTDCQHRVNFYVNELVPIWYEREKHPHYDPLPIFFPNPDYEPKAADEFYLLSGKSWMRCTRHADDPRLIERFLDDEQRFDHLWINAKRAAALGIKDGDWVWVQSMPSGGLPATGAKEKIRAKVTEGIHPSCCFIYFDFGHKSTMMTSRGIQGISHPDFTPPHIVPYTGGKAHNETLCRVSKA